MRNEIETWKVIHHPVSGIENEKQLEFRIPGPCLRARKDFQHDLTTPILILDEDGMRFSIYILGILVKLGTLWARPSGFEYKK